MSIKLLEQISNDLNFGLNGESRLKDVIPEIISLCAKVNPSKIEEVIEIANFEESYFAKPHPGLNSVVEAINKEKTSIIQFANSRINSEKEVVAEESHSMGMAA